MESMNDIMHNTLFIPVKTDRTTSAVTKSSPLLFNLSPKGTVQQWRVLVCGCERWVEYGAMHGVILTSPKVKCIAKYVGRPDERSPSAQAIFEAAALYRKRMKSGRYHTDLKLILENKLLHSKSKEQKEEE